MESGQFPSWGRNFEADYTNEEYSKEKRPYKAVLHLRTIIPPRQNVSFTGNMNLSIRNKWMLSKYDIRPGQVSDFKEFKGGYVDLFEMTQEGWKKENYADSKEQGITCDDAEDLDDTIHSVSLMHQESLAKAHNDDQRIAFEEEKRRISIAKGKEHVDSTFTLSTANTPPQSTGNTPTDSDDDTPTDGVFSTNSFDAEEGGVADYNNLDPTIDVPSTPTLRIHKDSSSKSNYWQKYCWGSNKKKASRQYFKSTSSIAEPKKVLSMPLADEIWVSNAGRTASIQATRGMGVMYLPQLPELKQSYSFWHLQSFMGLYCPINGVKSAFLWPTTQEEPQEHEEISCCNVYVDDTILDLLILSMLKDFEDLTAKGIQYDSHGQFLNKFDLEAIKTSILLIEAHKSLGKDRRRYYTQSLQSFSSTKQSKGSLSYAGDNRVIEDQLQEDVNILAKTSFLGNARNKQLWLISLYKA
ncbi:hypothetical protein Tco_0656402 [Tanacetum coccineum]|uniref:Uncharacterized protein n=1 Tax=Tanacetum coccineum TaxID=301880 RepID=A0ABQ4X8N0_9ASTR